MKRKGISKKLRFEIFSRDGFKCAYCGSKPPDAILEIDHINPVSKGGLNDEMNLITSCFGCNRGKSDKTINSTPNQFLINNEELKLKVEQMQLYQKHLMQIEESKKYLIDLVESKFTMFFTDRCITNSFKESIYKFIKKLGVEVVMESMTIACKKMDTPSKSLDYFCGICWNKIRQNEN